MPPDLIASLICDGLCVGVCLAAAVFDQRTLRIPNWLTYSALLAGLALQFALAAGFGGLGAGWTEGLLPSLAGAVLSAAVFGALSAAHVMGMGDMKLMAAVGALLQWPLALWALVYVLIAGAVLSVVVAVTRGQMGAVVGNLMAQAKGLFRRSSTSHSREIALHYMPYAAAIFAGTSWAVLSRYVAALRLF